MEEKNPFTIRIEDIKHIAINFTAQAYTKKKLKHYKRIQNLNKWRDIWFWDGKIHSKMPSIPKITYKFNASRI